MPDLTSAITRLTSARRRARHIMWWEKALPALRWPFVIAMLFILSTLARIPQSLPDWIHATFEIVCFIAFVWLCIRGIRSLPTPSTAELDRRIEHASHFSAQPLLTLTDQPAYAGSAEQKYIWATHVQRIISSLGPLRTGFPHIQLTFREKISSLIIVLALLLGFTISGSHSISRLYAGFVPGVDDDSVPLPTLQAWIEQPDFAPGAPIFLSQTTANTTFTVPQGATLNIIVTGAVSSPSIQGAQIFNRHQLDEKSWTAKATIQNNATLKIRSRGHLLGQWPITIIADLPPDVSWNGKPSPQKDDFRTVLPWKVHQSFGVASLEAEIHLPHSHNNHIIHIPIPLNGTPKQATGTAQPDLSSSPFAGMDVVGILHATSISKKENRSTPIHFTLGARKFSDPLAKAIIAVRQRLMLNQETPSQAAYELQLLTQTTDVRGIWAALALNIATLQHQKTQDIPETIPDQLWALALYLDDLRHDGPEIADSAAAVRAAQQGVQQQLNHMHDLGEKGRSLDEQKELQRRTQILKDALNRRMQLLFQKAAQNGIIMPQSQASTADPWSEEMQRLQSDASQGHGDEALKRLQQMEDMAEHMRQATPEDLKALAQQMQAREEAHAQHSALRDLIHRETALLDHTQARLSEAQKAAQAQNPSANNAQTDISQMTTSDLLRELGQQPSKSIEQNEAPSNLPTDPATVAQQSPARQMDHASQRALARVNKVLAQRVKELTQKPVKAFDQAAKDMASAQKSLADRNDSQAITAEQKVLKDLSDAGKEMQKNQASGGSGSGKNGRLSFIPSGGMGNKTGPKHGAAGQQGDNGDDAEPDDDSDDDTQQDKSKDPLGRKLGEGRSKNDSNMHIPDSNARDRARDIERELRRRAADRTRPQTELDYLNRLLKSF
ncbi:DUF4175 domain-containing protein [Swingsia samuiensis]|uniref:DUF4175 family protein n=1 Tax=Swingsia samuiensis TaxID=1293412 RepID=A0A4Y6UJ14_9PROT|nr:DUF4175 family protein [Swingsia samuiensis]QDH17619.1 DUF4175 family protein [Swingsia samuiensis]